MTTSKFIELWDLFSEQYLNIGVEKEVLADKVIKSWDDSSLWTKLVLGPSRRLLGEDSPLGDFIKHQNNELEYRTEEYKIDLAICKKDNLNFLNEEEGINIKGNSFYPSYYEVLIEHENDIKLCWQEMTKLTHFKAKLKVLITYSSLIQSECFDDQGDYMKLINSTAVVFGNIIKQANATYPENEKTEYILIIGQRREFDNKSYVKWFKFTFDSNGSFN